MDQIPVKFLKETAYMLAYPLVEIIFFPQNNKYFQKYWEINALSIRRLP